MKRPITLDEAREPIRVRLGLGGGSNRNAARRRWAS
jgi:hypothetical protein